MKSQNAKILEYLRAGNVLSPLEALNKFGSFRLGARIKDLRAAGHDIVNLEKTGTHARYKLKKSAEPITLPPAFTPKPQTLFT